MWRGVRVLVDPLLEAIEVELVLDVVLIDFAEEEVILESTEPLDPAHIDVFAELRLLAHHKYYLKFKIDR